MLLGSIKKGKFIVFEGIDGSGKSTQASILYERLVSEDIDCLLTEEPGGTDEGRIIKDLLLNPEYDLCDKTELFLFLADRAQHIKKVVIPALKNGTIVISSRYIFSTLVYQGYARKIASLSFLKEINMFAIENILPDIVFYIDVNPDDRLDLATRDSFLKLGIKGGDRIEREGINFQRIVREGYLKIAEDYKNIFRVINGHRDIVEINNEIFNIVEKEVLK